MGKILTRPELQGGATVNGVEVIDKDGNITAPIKDTLASGKIFLGDSNNVAQQVTMSGDATISNAGVLTVAAAAITRTKMSTPAGSKIQETGLGTAGTIATTSTSDGYVIVGESGSLSSVDFSGVDVLAASDTNYITFSITNLGQAGAGSNAMLAATAANTTQVTGGTAIAANTKRSLTLNGTPSNLTVVQGDRLRVRATVTGTLANTVTFSKVCLRFSGTT